MILQVETHKVGSEFYTVRVISDFTNKPLLSTSGQPLMFFRREDAEDAISQMQYHVAQHQRECDHCDD